MSRNIYSFNGSLLNYLFEFKEDSHPLQNYFFCLLFSHLIIICFLSKNSHFLSFFSAKNHEKIRLPVRFK